MLTDDDWRVTRCDNIETLRHDNEFCDVKIVGSDGQSTWAHSCVLASASPALRRQLALQQPPYTVYIEGISGYLWQVILHFIYVGEMCPLNDFEAVAVTAAGTRLGMESLSRNATRFSWKTNDDDDDDTSLGLKQKRRVSKTDASEKLRVRARRKAVRSSNNSAPSKEYMMPSLTSLSNAARNVSTHSRSYKDGLISSRSEDWYLPVMTSSSCDSDIVQLVRKKAGAKKSRVTDRVSSRSTKLATSRPKSSLSKAECSCTQDTMEVSRSGTRKRVNLVFPLLPWRKAKAWHKFQRWLQYNKLAGSDSSVSTNSVVVQTSLESNCHDIGMQTPPWQKRTREVSWEKTTPTRRAVERSTRTKRNSRNLCNHSSVNACNQSTTNCRAPRVKPRHRQHTRSNTQRKQLPFKVDARCVRKQFGDMTITRMPSHFGHCHCGRHHGRHVGMMPHGNNCHRTTRHSTPTCQRQRQPPVTSMLPFVPVNHRRPPPPPDYARSRSVPVKRGRPALVPPRSRSLPDSERRWRHSAPNAGRPGPPTGASCGNTPSAFTHANITLLNKNSSSNLIGSDESEAPTNNNNPQQSGLGPSLKRTSTRRACYGRDGKHRKCSKKQYPPGAGREGNIASLRHRRVSALAHNYSSTDCESEVSLPDWPIRVGCSGTADQLCPQGGQDNDITCTQRHQPPTFAYSHPTSGLRPECVQRMTPGIGTPGCTPAGYRRFNDVRKNNLDVFNHVQNNSSSSVELLPTRSNQSSLAMRRATSAPDDRHTRDDGHVAEAADGGASSVQSHTAPQITRSSSSQFSTSRSLNSVLAQSVKSIHWPPGVPDSSKAKLKNYTTTKTQWNDAVDASGRAACDDYAGNVTYNKTANKYTCIKCGSVFKSRRHYYRHMIDVHLNDPTQ